MENTYTPGDGDLDVIVVPDCDCGTEPELWDTGDEMVLSCVDCGAAFVPA